MALRVLNFQSRPPQGPVAMAVIFDDRNRISHDDALALFDWMTEGGDIGHSPVIPLLIDVRRLDETSGVRYAMIAEGMSPHFSKIRDFARRNRALTISADPACVRSGRCVVGVSSVPRVEVTLSREASASCGIEFRESFRMMVTEY